MTDLRTKILQAIESDDGFTPRQNDKLIKFYNNSTGAVQNGIDMAFIYLCGDSLRTLIDENN